MAGMVQTRHRRPQFALWGDFRAGDCSPLRLIGIVLEKGPASAVVFKSKRIGPEVTLGRIDPLKSGEVRIGLRIMSGFPLTRLAILQCCKVFL